MGVNRARTCATICTAAMALVMGAAAGRAAEPPPPGAAPAAWSETPVQRDARMAWWREARFGMFIHWGMYAQLAGEWNGKPINGAGEWIMETGHVPVSEYEKTAVHFNPVKYDPLQWVRTAKAAGVKYIVITSKHHDGFALWDSKLTDWDIMRTPYGKDLLRPLADACRAEGLRFGLYFTIMDWHHPDYSPRRPWNDLAQRAGEPDFARFVQYAHGQVEEIIRNYDPAVLWFDGEWEKTWTPELGVAMEADVRRLKPDIIINNRVGKARNGMAGLNSGGDKALGDFGTPEQEVPARGLPGVDWETCMTMNNTWGFVARDQQWKSPTQLVRLLIDIASKGGNFLLNVGPTPEGEIPAPSIERLLAMGAWLKINGEAVYGTSASPFRRLPWGRCTIRVGSGTSAAASNGRTTLYLHVFDWPTGGQLLVPGLGNRPISARLLAKPGESLKASPTAEGVSIKIPSVAPDAIASVIALEVDGSPEVRSLAIGPAEDGTFTLTADQADLSGPSIRTETAQGKSNIGFWTSGDAAAVWELQFDKPGRFGVELTLACQPGEEGDRYVVSLGASEVVGAVPATKGWQEYVTQAPGELVVSAPGRILLRVAPKAPLKGALMNLRQVRLVPAR